MNGMDKESRRTGQTGIDSRSDAEVEREDT